MRPTSAIPTLVAVLLTGPAGAGAEASPSAPDAELDRFVAAKMEEAGIVGLGAALIVDREVVWTKGWGFADRERGVPFTPRTVMNIGSISKTFTGVALMRAVEEGRLSLDEDLGAYLPFAVRNPHRAEARITLRQLATHTSGIADRPSVYAGCYHFDGEPPEPLGEFLRSYFVPGGAHYSEANFLDVAPGSHREYSNIAAGLAGYVVERAVGRSLGEYARQTIFAPLGMDDTAWSLAEVPPERHARLYVAQYGLSIPIPLYELTTYPDGGVRTSVADLAKLFVALLGDGAYEGTRILAKSSVDEMLRFHYTEANRPENVVLTEKNSGIFWSTKFDVTRVGHGGSDPGSKTEMLASLDRGIGVILFSNTSMAHDEARPFYDIFLELWKRAEATPRGGATPPVASGLAR